MLRILLFALTILTSTMTLGQNTSFDKKVESLFFNVDVTNDSVSLVDQFINVQSLTYIKPDVYSSSAGTNFWTHIFTFTTLPYIKSSFDIGFIVLTVAEINNIKQIFDIKWKLQFDNMENASKAFGELKRLFTQTNVKHRSQKLGDRAEIDEFTNDKAIKYPNITLALYHGDNTEKQYQVFFALDNDMHNGL